MPDITSERNTILHFVETEKIGVFSSHEDFALSLVHADDRGLRFDITYCGVELGWMRVERFFDPGEVRVTEIHVPHPPREGVDWNALAALAADEVAKMLTNDSSAYSRTNNMIAQLAGFGGVARSGAGRRGRPAQSSSLLAVRARRAFAATDRGEEERYAIDQARKRQLVDDGELTPKAIELLARVDIAIYKLLRVLEENESLKQREYARALAPCRSVDIDAAVWQLKEEGRIRADPATEELRRRSGARFDRIALR